MSTAALPLDIRLTQATTRAVLALGGCVLLAGALTWVTSRPMFEITAIRIEGDMQRNSAANLRANVLPHLEGNFFTMDMQAARDAFEAAPWVRHAVVRRVFPNRLVATVEEHQPAGIWREPGASDRLVNRQGEVFDANLGEVDNLPEFEGNPGQATQVMAMYHRLAAKLLPLDSVPVRVSLSPRGAWEVELRQGEVIVLGRGSDDEVIQRLDAFVRTITQVMTRHAQPWDRADLRHANGYALHFRTTPAAAGLRSASAQAPAQ